MNTHTVTIRTRTTYSTKCGTTYSWKIKSNCRPGDVLHECVRTLSREEQRAVISIRLSVSRGGDV